MHTNMDKYMGPVNQGSGLYFYFDFEFLSAGRRLCKWHGSLAFRQVEDSVNANHRRHLLLEQMRQLKKEPFPIPSTALA